MAIPQKFHCRVEKIKGHGEHVYTVELRPERKVPRFCPGQFLHLALDEYDPSGFWPESRVFSIAGSSPTLDCVCIVYSVRGHFTARMEEELLEGRKVWVKMPYGDFVIDHKSDVVLFAGGTGITAFTAFINGLKPDFLSSVYMAYGARSEKLLIFKERLQELCKIVPQLKVYYFVENIGDGDPKDISPCNPTEIISGRLSVEAMWPKINDPLNADYYLSGPPAMLKALEEKLREKNISPEKIKMDAWK